MQNLRTKSRVVPRLFIACCLACLACLTVCICVRVCVCYESGTIVMFHETFTSFTLPSERHSYQVKCEKSETWQRKDVRPAKASYCWKFICLEKKKKPNDNEVCCIAMQEKLLLWRDYYLKISLRIFQGGISIQIFIRFWRLIFLRIFQFFIRLRRLISEGEG